MARKKIVTFNIVYRKLGKEKAYGIADHNTNTLEIDSRLIGKKHLEILLHEGAHLLLPEMNEEGIVRLSASLTRLLWEEGYRRIDDRDILPLQDER